MNTEIEDKARILNKLLIDKEETEGKLKMLNENLDQLQQEFVKLMKDNNILQGSVEGVGIIKLDSYLWANIPKEKQEEVYNRLKEIGEGDLIKTVQSIHHKTLSGYVNGLIKEGKDIPEGINYGFKETVKIKE